MEAMVAIPGAEPWSAAGSGARATVGVAVVHDFTGNPIATRPLGQRLAAEGYAVEVPLLPGHGTSYRDLARTRYRDWYSAVSRVVDHLATGCETIVLVGHAMGGTIALDIASQRPEDVHGVVVINPLVLDPRQTLAKLAPVLQHLLPFLPRELAGMPSDDIARPGVEEGSYAVVSARAARSLLAALPRVRDQLADLHQPLLVAWSPEDHTVPATNARELIELAGSDDVTELECDRSYHVVMLDYDADRLGDAVVEFVARVAKG